MDAYGLPVRVIVTKGTEADCKQTCNLIEGFEEEYLLADRGYDSNQIIKQTDEQGIIVVIPPKKNKIKQREYDQYLYKIRHMVENIFLHLKRWRGITTRYAKKTSSFLAALQIRCMIVWSKII